MTVRPAGRSGAVAMAPRRPGAPLQPRAPRRSAKARGARWTPYLFLAPGFILFATFMLYPMLRSLWISFFDWKIFPGIPSTFVGLDQYRREFHDPIFWRALVNAGFYMLVTVPLQIVLGLIVAILLDAKIPGRGLFRALFYLPVLSSWVVVSLLFKFLFATDSGFVNWVLHDGLHVTGSNIGWLDSRWPALFTVSLLGVWKGVGWSMLIFLAALQGVSTDLKEAAAMDGANAWRSFLAVTLPALRGSIGFVSIMLVIGGLNVFTSIYVVTKGGPQQSTEVLLSYMYHQAFSFIDFGYGSALAFTLTLVVAAISFVQLRLFRGRAGEVGA